ncbi:MAG TPA: hypothetical protein VJJ98_07085, partial [Sedimentisphaerales bacterium]|nr:hypothetical protein [Sedimentisphaerales bacterium]
LEQMVDRLADDHENARRLAQGIANIDALSINVESVRTDIVYFEVACERITAEKLVRELEKRGVRILHIGPARLRAVTHYGITADDVDAALDAMREVIDGA